MKRRNLLLKLSVAAFAGVVLLVAPAIGAPLSAVPKTLATAAPDDGGTVVQVREVRRGGGAVHRGGAVVRGGTAARTGGVYYSGSGTCDPNYQVCGSGAYYSGGTVVRSGGAVVRGGGAYARGGAVRGGAAHVAPRGGRRR